MSEMEKAFYPNSIAVIGASTDPSKLGYRILKAVVEDGFRGKVYPVNISGGEILGIKAYKNISEISKAVDLALIAIPAKLVPEIVIECAKKQVSVVIVFSAGFAEIEKGVELEKTLSDIAQNCEIRIIGPNTNGLVNMNLSLNATFTPGLDYNEGPIGFVCQSGGYSDVILSYATSEGVGFSKIINVGNNCDVSFADILEFLAIDTYTEVIILYMEGFKDRYEGRKFYKIAKEVTKEKPIVAFKVGKTDAGKRAVQSHTGSLAGSDELYSAAFKQAGIIRASNGIEMIDLAKCLAIQKKLPLGNKVAILTNLGGPGVVATDICEAHGLILSEISGRTKEKLTEMLSFTASFTNPIDLAADWPHLHLYKKVLSTLLDDDEIDCVVIIVYIAPQSEFKILIDDFISVSKKYSKPIIACCLSNEDTRSQFIKELEKNNIPCYKRPEQAAEAMVSLVAYADYLRTRK